MPLDGPFALELARDHDGLEMGIVVRQDANLGTGQAGQDHLGDFVGRHALPRRAGGSAQV
jgi:hypothetical protein